MLDTFMRLRMNGPLDISKFNAMKYAKYWIDTKHFYRVDDPVVQFEKKEYDYENKKDTIYFEESSLF